MAGAKTKKRNKPEEGALGRALERLRALFPNKSPSWIRRALARVSEVDPLDEGLMLYLVYGRPELGDVKGQYQVFYSKMGGGIALTTTAGSGRGARAILHARGGGVGGIGPRGS